jgi:hypothetical protein
MPIKTKANGGVNTNTNTSTRTSKNVFASLYVSDSDSEDEVEVPMKKMSLEEKVATSSLPHVATTNTPQVATSSLPPSPSLRSFQGVKDENVSPSIFAKQGTSTYINAFLKGKGKERSNKKEDNDGWISIAWNKPRFVDDEEKKIKEEMLEEIILEEPVAVVQDLCTSTELKEEESTVSNEVKVKNWAEKIRVNLEKVETKRTSELSDDFISSLGKLSFFRKPLTVDN